jgi:hypothetical protein
VAFLRHRRKGGARKGYMTGAELSALAGCTTKGLCNVEKHGRVSDQLAQRIADALRVPIRTLELLGGPTKKRVERKPRAGEPK